MVIRVGSIGFIKATSPLLCMNKGPREWIDKYPTWLREEIALHRACRHAVWMIEKGHKDGLPPDELTSKASALMKSHGSKFRQDDKPRDLVLYRLGLAANDKKKYLVARKLFKQALENTLGNFPEDEVRIRLYTNEIQSIDLFLEC